MLKHRWCLKEAAYKSLSSHIHPRWTALAMTAPIGSAPTMRLTDAVKWRSRSKAVFSSQAIKLHCTLSNDAGLAVGVVLAMREELKA